MSYAPHQMLPDDLKAYAAPRPRRMEYVFAAIALALALYAWSQPVTPEPAPVIEPASSHAHATALIAACLNGGALSWKDPHSGSAMLTVCDTHAVPLVR